MNKTVTLNGEYTAVDLINVAAGMNGDKMYLGRTYWYIGGKGQILKAIWKNGDYSLIRQKSGNLWLVKPSEEEVEMWNLRQESLNYIDFENYVDVGQEYKHLYAPKRFHKAWTYKYTNIKPQQ